jgi:hypothetical protein
MVPKGVPLLPQIEARAPHGFILRYCPHSFRHWPLVPPAEGSQQNVSRHLRFPNLRHSPASSLHSPEPPGCRTPHPRRPRSQSGSPATSGRASACAPAYPCLAVSLLCLCFLLCLPRHARTPRQPRWFRQECSLPISLAAERRTRPSCTTTHTRPVKLQGRQQPFYGCGEHFGPTAPCGGIRRGPSPH